MTITFKKCISEKNHLTREFEGSGASHTGTLRGEASVTDPVIQIPGTATILDYNYLEIPAFNRKYFINDTPSLVNGMWVIQAHVDVIGTYLEEILQCDAMTSDKESGGNLYIDHGNLFVDDRTITCQMPFTKYTHTPFHVETLNGKEVCGLNPAAWTNVLIVAGPGPSSEPEPEPTPSE